MKLRLFTFLTVILCFSGARLHAQGAGMQYYTFQLGDGTYTVLDTNKTMSANHGNVWVEDDIDSIPIGFKFRFLDHDISYLYSNQVNLFMPQRDYYFTPFGNFLIYDRANNTKDTLKSISPINYTVDSSLGAGHKIFKIQWVNAGFFFDSLDVMYLNLQIWLYEGSNTIEVHYGPANVDMRLSQVYGCGPLVGLAKLDTIKGVETYELDLTGDPQNPGTIGLNQNGKRCIDGLPSSGTIYRFYFHDSAKTTPLPSGFNIYPVPTAAMLNISLPANTPAHIQLLDMLGRVVISQPVAENKELDISRLRNGMYYATLSQGNNTYNQKILLIK